MYHFVLLLLCLSVFCLAEESSLFFYQSTHKYWHVNDGDTILTVTNPEEFNVTHGFAFADYVQEGYNITLSKYDFSFNPDANVKSLKFTADSNDDYNDCPLFTKKVMIVAYRVQHRNDKEGCNSIETVHRYLQYFDSHLRLISGNRVRVDLENSLISNVCCPCSEGDCYGPDAYGNFMNKVNEACNKLDPRLTAPRMTRLYINDGFGGFAGLASLGNINSFANNGNYWAICNVNSEPTEAWHWSYQLSVVIHELGHTMGFGHASYTEANPTSFMKDYNKPDNYGDGGNVMGGGADWDTIAGPIQYYNVFTNKKVEPFYFHTASASGRKTIRLFAWDHPYVRPFLGIEAPRFANEDVIDSIPYENNMLTYEFPYNREDMCSTISDLVSFGSFYLEYRNKRGNLNGAGNRGVRLIQGRVTRTGGYDTSRSVMLSAGVDGVAHWGDGVIPMGVLWVPKDADKGTIGVQIKKLHSVADYVVEEQLDHDIQPLKNIPYMEVEVTYTPNVKYIPPLHPSPLPSYEYSPNIQSCTQNEDSKGWTCNLIGNARFWMNMKDFAHRGHPRVWNENLSEWIDSAATSIVSFERKSRLSWVHFYGDYTRGQCKVVINRQKSGGSSVVWTNTKLYRRGIHESDDMYKHVDSGDIFIASGFNLKNGEKLYIMDLYGYEEEIDVNEGENHLMHKLPTRTLPGFYEAYLVKKVNGVITFSQPISQYNAILNEDRIAVEIIDSSMITISSAGIPSTMFSSPSMFSKQALSKNQKLPVFLQDWKHGDFVFIDLEKIPRNLIMYIDSDDGVISLDYKRFGGQKGISIKLSYTQYINHGSVNGQLHKIWFNHAVTVLSIRPAIATNVANAQGVQGEKLDYYNLGNYRYKGEMKGFNTYVARSYSCRFNGKKYDLNTEVTDQYLIEMKDTSLLAWVVKILLWVVIIVVVIFVFILFSKCKRSDSKKQLPRQETTRKKSTLKTATTKSFPSAKTTPPPPPPTALKQTAKTTPPPPPAVLKQTAKTTPPPPPPSALKQTAKTTPPPPPSALKQTAKTTPPPPPPSALKQTTKTTPPPMPAKAKTTPLPVKNIPPEKPSNPFDRSVYKSQHPVAKPPKSPFKPT